MKEMMCGDCTLFGVSNWAWSFGSDHQCGKFRTKVCYSGTPACAYGRSRARWNSGKPLFGKEFDHRVVDCRHRRRVYQDHVERRTRITRGPR